MKPRLIGIIVLILLLAGYVALFPQFERARRNIRKVEVKGLTMPPAVVKLLSLEFRTIAADFLFVRASQFYGGKVERSEDATREDWEWLYRNLDMVTELDPYFEDPYQLGNALLTWEAGMFRETNAMLEKGMNARSWDWQLPFFIGFNKFFFLHENKSGADYLLKAYGRPGAWPFLPTLAARLYNSEGLTQAAIAMLLQFWEAATDPGNKRDCEIRINALRGVLLLENAIAEYKKKTGKRPKDIQALVSEGVIKEIPKDPYGGVFYIDKDGSIKTTSKFAFAPKDQGKK